MQKKHRINPTMTEGSLAKNMLLFSLPLMASNVLQVLFNMSDIAVVGQFAGSHALGSVGSTAILVTLFTGILIGFGSGINIIVARFLGARKDRDVTESVHTAFLLSAIVGLVTLAAGFKGGEVVPSFFVGATFGCAVSPLLGLPVGFGAAIGLAAVFCGVTNCPVASTLLAVELFGAEGMLYFALACCLSYMLSGYQGLYSSQTILYSKLKAQFINVHTNAYHAGEKTE